jgi:hypothetical protein
MQMYQTLRAARRQASAILGIFLMATSAQAQEAGTTLSGEVRVRTESLRPVTDGIWDNYTLLRTRLGVTGTVNSSVRAFAQLQDSRVFGGTPGTMHASAAEWDLHQGWVEFSGTVGNTKLALRGGRQEIVLGNERLVGAVGWSNTGRVFDAARLGATLPGGSAKADIIFATIAEGGARHRDSNGLGLESDRWLAGLYGSSRLLDVHLLYDDNARHGVYRDVDRFTAGGMLKAPADFPLVATAEGSYQFGRQTAQVGGTAPIEQDVSAWLAGGRLGRNGVLRGVRYVGVGADLLSGDAEPLDGTYRAFNTLYATNHKFYGYIDLFLDPAARTGGRGLTDLMANARIDVTGATALEVDVHRFLLAQQGALESRAIGWELDLTYPFRFADAGRILVGYSLFRNGPAAQAIGLGTAGSTWHWGFVQAAVSF